MVLTPIIISPSPGVRSMHLKVRPPDRSVPSIWQLSKSGLKSWPLSSIVELVTPKLSGFSKMNTRSIASVLTYVPVGGEIITLLVPLPPPAMAL